VVLPPATFEDTPEAAEHLLRVPGVRVLVDGYNVTLTAKGALSLADQRRWLLDAVSGVAARTGAVFDVVFDGDEEASAPADRSRRLGVQVRFTAADVEADDVLLEMLAALPADLPVVVVSDDRRVREGCRLGGGNVVGVASLVEAFRR
jgi:predicted RNA-binding protein with PIN domain